MAIDWNQKKEDYEKSFQRLLVERKIPGRYFIPKKYSSSAILYSEHARKLSAMKEDIIQKDALYLRLQNKFPETTGKMLEILFENTDITLFVKPMSIHFEQVVKEIFVNGLPMKQDAYVSEFSKEKHFPTLLSKIYDCNPIKHTYGCLLIRIPKDLKLPIYYQKENQLYLLPGYIYGFIPVDNHHIGNIEVNPNYSATHQYNPDGLLYDELLTYDEWRKYYQLSRIKRN